MSTYLTDKTWHENWHPRQLSKKKLKEYQAKLLTLQVKEEKP
jgi:hypothetical protein